MNAQTVKAAVAKRDDANAPENLIDKYAPHFAKVLPSHIRPDLFTRLAQGTLRRDGKLADAANRNPASFLAAMLDCARLGHEPGTDQYAFVPFKDGQNGTVEVVGIEQYQGVIERMYRAGAVATVKAEVVRGADHFTYNPSSMDRPDHDVDWFDADRGELRGVYAYAVMKDGSTSRVVVMDRKTVMRHKAMSRGSDTANSPWKKWEESMWLKTAVHELEKWVPTSAEYRREQLRAIAEADKVRQSGTRVDPFVAPGPAVDPDTGEVFDAEVVPEPEPAGGESK